MSSHWRAFKLSDIELLLKLSKEVYPNNDLSSDSVALWYKEDQNFCIVFYDPKEPSKVTGILSCIPLNSIGWEDLIAHKVSEAGVTQDHLYSESCHMSLGVHIYHIERLPGWEGKESFHVAAFGVLNRVLEEYKNRNRFKMCGMSAFCTSPSGDFLFGTILSFRENSQFICTKQIYRALPPKEPFLKVCDHKSVLEKEMEGFEHVIRCKMFVLKSEIKSRIWDFKIEE